MKNFGGGKEDKIPKAVERVDVQGSRIWKSAGTPPKLRECPKAGVTIPRVMILPLLRGEEICSHFNREINGNSVGDCG